MTLSVSDVEVVWPEIADSQDLFMAVRVVTVPTCSELSAISMHSQACVQYTDVMIALCNQKLDNSSSSLTCSHFHRFSLRSL